VAYVTEIERAPELEFALIKAEPTARLNRSREVLLVWSGDRIGQMKTRQINTPKTQDKGSENRDP
jgi:cell shape-determining protein MreC